MPFAAMNYFVNSECLEVCIHCTPPTLVCPHSTGVFMYVFMHVQCITCGAFCVYIYTCDTYVSVYVQCMAYGAFCVYIYACDTYVFVYVRMDDACLFARLINVWERKHAYNQPHVWEQICKLWRNYFFNACGTHVYMHSICHIVQ